MSWLPFRAWAGRLRPQESREADLERELRNDLDLEAEERRETGMSPEEARRSAVRALGNVALIQEDVRQTWAGAWLERLFQDIRHSLRAIRRSPGFAAITILSLAVGIGASTSVFTVFHALFLRGMAVQDPQQLRIVNWTSGPRSPAKTVSGYFYQTNGRNVCGSFSFDVLQAFQKRATGFSSVAGFARVSQVNVRGRSVADVADIQLVSGNFFETLGMQPPLGRALARSDDSLGAPPVVALSWRLAQLLFGDAPSALGSPVIIQEVPYTIVGILPPGFAGLSKTSPSDAYLPLARAQQLSKYYSFTQSDNWWIEVLGRVDPQKDDRQVKAALDVILDRAGNEFAATTRQAVDIPKSILIDGRTGLDAMDKKMRKSLLTLFAMVGLMFLVACANVANLLLERGTARAHELAVRLSLGAGRLRLARHLLSESLLLALCGGAMGMVLARVGTFVLAGLLVRNQSAALDLKPDAVVIGFAVALSIATALLFGVVPAWRSTRVDPASCLRQGGPGRSPGLKLARSLVVVQVASAFVLVFGAGLCGRTLVNLVRVPLGFHAGNTLLFYVNPSRSGYKEQRLIDVYRRIQERVAAIPGVQVATFSSFAPISGWMSSQNVTVPGYTPKPGERISNVYMLVSDGFLTKTGTPILVGRDLSATDGENSARVAVVNETFAKRYFTGNPVGREFAFGKSFTKPIRIVGVAMDARTHDIRGNINPSIYLPFAQHPDRLSGMTFELRTGREPLSFSTAVRRAVSGIDATVPVAELRTQEQQIDRLLSGERMFAFLSSFFSLITVGLACIGIYGVSAYAVARRTAEFGIRMAIGASRGHVYWLVLRTSLLLVSLGIVIAIPAALAVGKLVGSRLYGVEPADAATMIAAGVAMALVAAVAGWIPARRAAHLDPLVALRYE